MHRNFDEREKEGKSVCVSVQGRSLYLFHLARGSQCCKAEVEDGKVCARVGNWEIGRESCCFNLLFTHLKFK